MKAKRFLLFLFAAGLLLTGCTEKVYVPTADTTKLDYEVRASQWRLEGDSYRVVLDAPDITSTVVAHGNVQVSRCFPGENHGIDIWTPLPFMRTEMETNANGQNYYYTTFIDYEWTKGSVSVYATASDLYTGYAPGDMYFRVFVTQ